MKAFRQRFIPNKIVVVRPASESEAREIIRVMPFLENQVPLENKATAYVCGNYVCKLQLFR